MTPRVTIAIPFFDEEKQLREAIASVLGQTMGDLEVLLVDDGSRDRSLDVARSFRDPRVVVLSDGVRRRLPARLNEIARRASAPLVARMDGDDVSHPERIARQLAMLEGDRSLALVATWAGIVDSAGTLVGIVEAQREPPSVGLALNAPLVAHATILARREWLLANPYDESLTRAEDRDLWCRTADTLKLGVIPEPLYVIRTSGARLRFLPDYLEAQAQNRIVFRRYGPRARGLLWTARALATSHAKSSVMRGASAFGLVDGLVRRRGRSPTQQEREMVDAALCEAQRP